MQLCACASLSWVGIAREHGSCEYRNTHNRSEPEVAKKSELSKNLLFGLQAKHCAMLPEDPYVAKDPACPTLH